MGWMDGPVGLGQLSEHSIKFLIMKYLTLSFVILLPVLLCGNEDFASKIQKISKQSLSRKEISQGKDRLIGCLNESSTSAERGIVYAAIAGVYGHDLHRFAFDAIRYARKALTNDLDIIEECKQHLIVACAQDVLVRDGKIDAIGAKKARGVCLIHGLSFVLDHLSNDKCVPLTSVGKFEADASDPRHGELVRRHAEQMKARNHIRLQNQLIYYRDEFCVRLIELYGVKLLQETEFRMLLDEIRATSEKKREIILRIRSRIDDANIH